MVKRETIRTFHCWPCLLRDICCDADEVVLIQDAKIQLAVEVAHGLCLHDPEQRGRAFEMWAQPLAIIGTRQAANCEDPGYLGLAAGRVWNAIERIKQ